MASPWLRVCQRSRSSLRDSARITIAAPAARLSCVFRCSDTMRPSASEMTRSAMAATAALCVMTAVVVPSSRLTRSIASSTTMPVEMSSAPVGSSHSSTSGRLAIARAMATRCCSPPDSCEGKWSTPLAQPDHAQRLGGRHRLGGDVGDELDVLARGQAGNQVVELEHEADMLAAVLRQLALVGRGEIVIAIADGSRRGHVEAAEDVQQRRLAAARRPEHDDELGLKEVEIDAAQRVHVDLAHVVDLGQAACFEDR